MPITLFVGPTDYVEFYGSVGAAVGPAEVTLGVAYAPNQDSLDFGGGERDNFYVYGDVGVGIPNTPVTLMAHLGYTDGVLTFTNDGDAFDYSVGAEVALGEIVSVGLAYVDVEGDTGPLDTDAGGTFSDDAFVVTLNASF